MRDLSVLIPARNEMWLNRTVADVLEHTGAGTEVIAVLDGAWPAEPLPQHERLQVLYRPQATGQRAATNDAARVSSARYVCKLDAHCAVAPGFDEAMLEAAEQLGPEATLVPAQWNLHVFDWVCQGCGTRRYQGPTPGTCACGGEHVRDVVWTKRRLTEFWRFDSDLKFQYWGERRRAVRDPLAETMSCLGACWMMGRERYWQLGGLDEGHGSWGQMGTELACKSWLSGGRLMVVRGTWFAHMFRTQGQDFGFPYEISGREQEAARAYSRRLWLGNGWPGQAHPLRWLVDRFWPVPGWTPAAREALGLATWPQAARP